MVTIYRKTKNHSKSGVYVLAHCTAT